MVVQRRVSTLGSAPLPVVVALGNFTVLHHGDQRVVERMIQRARELGGHSVVILPVVRRRSSGPGRVACLQKRLQLLSAIGCDTVVLQRGTTGELDSIWESFVADMVRRDQRDRLVAVVAQAAASCGWDRLAGLCRSHDVELISVAPFYVGAREVTNTAVVDAIARGALDEVRAMLGRDHSVAGCVLPGFRRGRTIGFPTANLRIVGTVLPPNGVYAVRVEIGVVRYDGVANLGVNPTFGGAERTLEPHIFGFEGNLYGKRISVEFVDWLRPECKFASVDDLRAQIARDVATARVRLQLS